MTVMKKLVILPLICCILPVVQAQQSDSIRVLPEARVQDVRKPPASPGKQAQYMPIDPLQATVAGLLNSYSSGTIRSYGPGLLSSLSIRGTGPAHTPILWNGLNIQSSMYGQHDLNLIPSFFFENVSFIPGTQNNFNTGGILGGSVSLGSYRPRVSRVLAGADAGSFSTCGGRLGFDHRKGRWSNRFRLYGQQARNNFPYTDPSQASPVRKEQENAAVRTASALNELAYESAGGYVFSLSAWWQDANRQIPPTLQSSSTARQEDENLRLNFSIEKNDSLVYWQWNSGFFVEHLWYHDPERNLEGYNHSNTFINQFQYRRNWKGKIIQAGLSHFYSQAGSNSYLDNAEKSQQRTAPYVALSGEWKKLRWKSDLRQEFIDRVVPRPSWSLGADYSPNTHSRFSAYLTQVSRLPNLNDLYWNPGGNPDLRPEQGHSAELGYFTSYKHPKGNLYFTTSVSAFYSIIENWIIWLPDGGFWTPQNLQEVHSRGGEWNFDLFLGKQKEYLRLNYRGSFTLASNEKAKTQSDLSVGKQLIYVPFWKNNVEVSYRFYTWEISYNHVFTGGRYTATDHSSFLKPYSTGDLRISHTYRSRKHRFTSAFGVLNTWDVYYESIMRRPMPGRYLQLSIDYQFIKI